MAQLSYEKAFERLEQILQLMNSGKTPLEEALKLYEEAETLMQSCSLSLNAAEKKVEQLMKGRNGELLLSENHKPKTENFIPGGIQKSEYAKEAPRF